MLNPLNLLKQKPKYNLEQLSELINQSPEYLQQMEALYQENILTQPPQNFLETNAKQASQNTNKVYPNKGLEEIINKIVEELVERTPIYHYDPTTNKVTITDPKTNPQQLVTLEEINNIPESLRPDLTGTLIKREIEQPAYYMILDYYNKFKQTNQKEYYFRFLQGLDILDLDEISYNILGLNKNTMGRWLPELVEAQQTLPNPFFKVPETTIVKPPLPLLQLTRLDYQNLTPTTLQIVDRYAERVFNLNPTNKYFLKTGTYSSKFDFRNAKVDTPEEVKDIGEYLLYIHYQALQHANFFMKPMIVGMSTTNEWVVRNFIEDTENNPTIYKGLPLRTEFRIFVDFDTQEIIGTSPYWREDIMEKRFLEQRDIHDKHDYITFNANKEKLKREYDESLDLVTSHLHELIPAINLKGQYSIDIMKNGKDFYIIDMATAEESALNDVIPKNKLKQSGNWRCLYD